MGINTVAVLFNDHEHEIEIEKSGPDGELSQAAWLVSKAATEKETCQGLTTTYEEREDG